VKRIPVVVVAGFLGSGKTTLLNHLLTTARGTRIGVVVNDFGAIGIDAMTVAGQVDSTVSLSGGCLCCAVDVTELDGMLARLDSQVDVIVVEASGLAEPQAMVKLVLGSENPRIAYGGLVLLVDAAEFPDDLARHLKVADLVVLNKVDRAPAHAELLTRIDTLNQACPSWPPPTAASTRPCSSTRNPAHAKANCRSRTSWTTTNTTTSTTTAWSSPRAP
jgi:G3E family GTPase